ncbi:unnamed protein product [Pleuronectes platessa]|uniref:Uncharacterized protein n=1 Tax=Pleuronectes platessa TaxID=8262 RepID=A0A9N7U7W9_PLEPL|nr:unnamed protein product [Pleuronectes platessa]
MKYRDAFSHVQERRFCINPNVGFVHQLQEYEAIYSAKLTIKMMSPMQLGRSFSLQAGMPGSRKRSLEEDEDFGAMQTTRRGQSAKGKVARMSPSGGLEKRKS